MLINELFQVIIESASIAGSPLVVRNYEDKLFATTSSSKLIKVLSGMRRSGKSFLLKRMYQKLLSDGIPKNNILFLNFENDLLKPYLSSSGLREIFQLFESQIQKERPIFAFLDEIQNVDDWHSFIRSKYDIGKINFFLTGSNSRLLSSEISSTLGGRTLELYIQPFNFSELLSYNNILSKDVFSILENRNTVSKLLADYLSFGAIVESLELTAELKQDYRRSLIQRILLNDVLKRFALDYPEHLEELMHFLERSLGGIVSNSSLAKQSNISDVTVGSYLSYLTQAFLINPLAKFQFRSNKIFKTQYKYYFTDNIFSAHGSEGGKLENLIYLELSRKYGKDKVFFARNEQGHEIDFLVFNQHTKIIKAVQSAYEITVNNLNREAASLKLLKKYHNYSYSSEIVVYKKQVNQKEEQELFAEHGIRILELLDWILEI